MNCYNLIKKCLQNYHKPVLLNLRRNLSLASSLNQECAVKEGNDFHGESVPDYVDLAVCPLWEGNDENIKLIRSRLLKDMKIIENFITDDEEKSLCQELEPILKKMRYEYDHWDDAIHGFRETERVQWTISQDVIKRAKETAVSLPETPLPHMHVLDLDAKGYIKPHVDAVRFCGPTVAGICLLSPAIMRLRHTEQTDLFADFLLNRKCFYIMGKSSRYDFTHEILKNELSKFKNKEVVRTRRLSVITRSQPSPVKED